MMMMVIWNGDYPEKKQKGNESSFINIKQNKILSAGLCICIRNKKNPNSDYNKDLCINSILLFLTRFFFFFF